MIFVKNHTNWLQQQAELNPSLTAIISEKTEFSFLQYFNASKKMASYISSKGVSKGSHVAIFSNNNFHFSLLINAIWILGAIPVPINTRLLQREIKKQINFVETTHLFYESSLFTEVSNIKNKFVTPDINKIENSAFSSDALHSENNTAVILFTSGTTKNPRAVQLSFRNLFYSAAALDKETNLTPDDKWLVSLPFYHIGGFSMITRSLLTGSSIIFPNSFGVNDMLETMTDQKPTMISLVPTLLQRFLELNISPNENLRCVFLGGGPARNKLIIDSIKKGWNIFSVYGSTETCSMVTALHPKEQKLKTGSSGKPLGKNRISIIPLKSSNKAKLKAGIISITGQSVMKGYYKQTPDSKKLNNTFTSDDIGFIDSDGYLFVICRKDDIIISGGENINMKEVSKIISKLSDIKECYLFALPDKHWESILCAAVVTKSDDATEYKLRSELKKRLASYKIPKKYFFLNELPKTELGKIDRAKLFSCLDL
jgi:O-succinylbenzoic acid--CoA ligase